MLNTINSSMFCISGSGPTPIGNLVNDNFTTNLNDYNVVTAGGANISINANKLRLSNGAGLFTTYMTYNKAGSLFNIHCFERWKMTAKFTTPNISGSTYGFGLGIRSTVSTSGFTALDTMVRLAMDTGSTVGSLWFYSAANHAATPNTDNQGSFALGNITSYIFEVERIYNLLVARIKSADGLTTHLTITKTYNISSVNGVWSHNVGQFCLWNFGGTIDITNLTITTDTQRNIDVLFYGDSNMHGLYCGNNASRYCAQAATELGKSYEILAGVDHGTAEIQQYKDLIAYLNPKIIYINGFSNDFDHSVPQATYRATYTDIVNTAKGLNKKVIHGDPIARTIDFSSISPWLESTFPGDQVVKLYDFSRSGGTAMNAAYNAGDGVHTNLTFQNAAKTPMKTAIQNA